MIDIKKSDDIDIQERVDNYLRGRMNDEERVRFLIDVEKDADLREAYEITVKIKDALARRALRTQELRSRMADWEFEAQRRAAMQPPAIPDACAIGMQCAAESTIPNVARKSRRWMIIAGSAAVFLCLVVAGMELLVDKQERDGSADYTAVSGVGSANESSPAYAQAFEDDDPDIVAAMEPMADSAVVTPMDYDSPDYYASAAASAESGSNNSDDYMDVEKAIRERLSKISRKNADVGQGGQLTVAQLTDTRVYELEWIRINLLVRAGRNEQALNALITYCKVPGPHHQESIELRDELSR